MIETVASILRALSRHRLDASSEERMQAAVAQCLDASGIVYTREVSLSKKDRIDFLTDDGVGIELKVEGRAIEAAARPLPTPSPEKSPSGQVALL